MNKLIIPFLCLVVALSYYFVYRPSHMKAQAQQLAIIAQVKRTNDAKQFESKLEAAWKQTLTSSPADGDVDVAVFDNANGGTAEYSTTSGTLNTASIMKLSILEDILWQDQHKGTSGLTSSQLQQAQPMIENSDNNAASALYDAAGGSKALNTFFAKIGATRSLAGDHWGLTQTTARDQLKVINQIAYPGKLLTPASVNQANQLLNNVESDQRWGVTGGVPSDVSVQLKDGWLNNDGDTTVSGYNWNINSIGHVHGEGVDYTIAVLTDNNSTMQDGIDTIQALSTDAWNTVSTIK